MRVRACARVRAIIFLNYRTQRTQIKENIYKSVNKYPFDNKSVKLIYSSGFSKPLSQKSVELLHEQYNNKSNILTNL